MCQFEPMTEEEQRRMREAQVQALLRAVEAAGFKARLNGARVETLLDGPDLFFNDEHVRLFLERSRG